MINKIKEFVKKLVAKFAKKKEASEDKVEESSDDGSSHQQIFTEEEKDALLDLIRPIIKNLNNDEAYVNICKRICDSKTLKTFSSISEDGSTLIINLTQSKIFNNKISEFASNEVEPLFRVAIDNKYTGRYNISSENGYILIKKVG